jgi:murein L,D-transpeptidase YcbB/YkuD
VQRPADFVPSAVDEENQIRFFDDIYGYDAALAKALAVGYPW